MKHKNLLWFVLTLIRLWLEIFGRMIAISVIVFVLSSNLPTFPMWLKLLIFAWGFNPIFDFFLRIWEPKK